jgi:hypothetical protein
MYFTNKSIVTRQSLRLMATLEQLENQKQDLINSLNQILNDSSIPFNDKMPVIKELSRAIANISEQINKHTPEKKKEEAKKEEIKRVKKEKKELQPTQIPEKAEEAKWRMEDIIKVIKLDLSKIDYIEMVEGWGTFIDWDKFWDQARPILLNEIKEKMEASKFKFPIVLQTSMKVMVTISSKNLENLLKLDIKLIEPIAFLTLSLLPIMKSRL